LMHNASFYYFNFTYRFSEGGAAWWKRACVRLG
jgi:hypothetical protein